MRALDLFCPCGALITPMQMYCERCTAEIDARHGMALEYDDSADVWMDAEQNSEHAA